MNTTVTTETAIRRKYQSMATAMAESPDAVCAFNRPDRQLSAVGLLAPPEHYVSDNYAKINGLWFAEFCLLRNIGLVDKAIADNYVNGGLHQLVIGDALREHRATLKKNTEITCSSTHLMLLTTNQKTKPVNRGQYDINIGNRMTFFQCMP